jgi:tryptophan halogenase
MSTSDLNTSTKVIRTVCVIGGGSAGFMAALGLKIKIPAMRVRVIRSQHIGIIGVGEGSTGTLTHYLHKFLKVEPKKFHSVAQPTWKLGLKFIWGPRPYFNYTFGPGLEVKSDPLQSKPNGFYCDDNIEDPDLISALMTEDRVFATANGAPVPHSSVAYHFENEKFVAFLEGAARSVGIEIVDDTVTQISPGAEGIQSLTLQSGAIEMADLFVDCSGFASILLGGALKEPFISYRPSLFCERAVVGGWNRADSSDPADQIIKPYTTCETMDAGWAWQIEHEHRINRGYVYCPDFITDQQAEAELRGKSPRIGKTRIVKFTSGRYERGWVGNVVAIGNASGFVEPLEATALGVIARQSATLTDILLNSDQQPPPTQVNLYNRQNAMFWDSIRGFLALHYKCNTRLDTPFWQYCREKTDLASAAPVVDYYRENGPDGYWGYVLLDNIADQFTLGGYLTMLVGMKVPYRKTWTPKPEDLARFEANRQKHRDAARTGFTVRQTLQAMRSPNWVWKP